MWQTIPINDNSFVSENATSALPTIISVTPSSISLSVRFIVHSSISELISNLTLVYSYPSLGIEETFVPVPPQTLGLFTIDGLVPGETVRVYLMSVIEYGGGPYISSSRTISLLDGDQV